VGQVDDICETIRLENLPLILSLSFISGFALSITVLNIQCPSQENVAGVIHCMAQDVVSPRENSVMPGRGQDSAVIIACCNSSQHCTLALARNELTPLIKTLVLGSFNIFGRSICVESSQIHVNARGCVETSWNVGQGASYVG
jgi:hypothetical protein